MINLRVLGRLVQIQRVLLKHGLDDFVYATHLYRPLRFLFYLAPWMWFRRGRDAPRGLRLRLALQELGPLFVKFGQAISTRRDLLPPDIADEQQRGEEVGASITARSRRYRTKRAIPTMPVDAIASPITANASAPTVSFGVR
jgi:hypothetical protein